MSASFGTDLPLLLLRSAGEIISLRLQRIAVKGVPTIFSQFKNKIPSPQ